jgi:hypothetical protein
VILLGILFWAFIALVVVTGFVQWKDETPGNSFGEKLANHTAATSGNKKYRMRGYGGKSSKYTSLHPRQAAQGVRIVNIPGVGFRHVKVTGKKQPPRRLAEGRRWDKATRNCFLTAWMIENIPDREYLPGKKVSDLKTGNYFGLAWADLQEYFPRSSPVWGQPLKGQHAFDTDRGRIVFEAGDALLVRR